MAEEEKEVNALSEDGVIPESEGKLVPYLVIDADGAPWAKEGARLLGGPPKKTDFI